MKAISAVLVLALAGFAFWYFSGGKWSGYRWNEYVAAQSCIPVKVPEGKGPKSNVLELAGEGETTPYVHRLSAWSCADGKLVAIYEGLPEVAPPRLLYKDALRFRHGFLAGDDSRRFVTLGDLARMKSIKDWTALVASRPL